MFHWEEPLVVEADKGATYDIELNIPQKKGTISKCLFSADRLREGKLPYCVSSCPNGVYYFGDENQDAVTNGTTKETFRLSQLLKDNGGYHLMPELGTKPRVYYLPPKNRLFEFNGEGEKVEGQG
jgi:molybdopterin-containing oxidoreductase family iron-sulfur binding subunit